MIAPPPSPCWLTSKVLLLVTAQGEKDGGEVKTGHLISCTASGSKLAGAGDVPPWAKSLDLSKINDVMKFASGSMARVKVCFAPVTMLGVMMVVSNSTPPIWS